ncbi:MAG: hypothetical protein U0T73_11055 [Chitinophagales bacterium]
MLDRTDLPLVLLAVTVLIFSACKNKTEDRRRSVDDFRDYVEARSNDVQNYTDSTWRIAKDSFQLKWARLASDTDEMDDEVHATYVKAVNQWHDMEAHYAAMAGDRARLAEMDGVRNSLTIPGVRNDFTDLTAGDALNAYEHFVNVVKQKKDDYSKEQWNAVNMSWKNLNGRRRELDKDLKAETKSKIVKLQFEYTGIKAVNRPFAESEEKM